MLMLLNLFFMSLMGFIALYVLRGIGFLTFIPGGAILALLLSAVVSGLIWGIMKTRRY